MRLYAPDARPNARLSEQHHRGWIRSPSNLSRIDLLCYAGGEIHTFISSLGSVPNEVDLFDLDAYPDRKKPCLLRTYTLRDHALVGQVRIGLMHVVWSYSGVQVRKICAGMDTFVLLNVGQV